MSLDSNDFQSLTPENTGIHEEIKTLSRGTQVTVIGNIIGRVLTFISQLLLARLLGPSLFGIYMVGWTLQRVVMLFSTFGFDRAAVMYGIQYWKQQNDRFSNSRWIAYWERVFYCLPIPCQHYFFETRIITNYQVYGFKFLPAGDQPGCQRDDTNHQEYEVCGLE
jgi:hypothetical protein